jgi:hypothetical protein
MNRSAALLVLAAFAAWPASGVAARLRPANGAVFRGMPPRPVASGQVARRCTGPSVPVWFKDPDTGRRVKGCKCAPGATGRLVEALPQRLQVLRCLRQVGPRP